MFVSGLLALAACLSTTSAAYQGFNSGASFSDGSCKQYQDFVNEFNAAKSLEGTSGFTSFRLYTMIQCGTTSDVTSAIQAAIDTDTSLLLGMWASAGDSVFANELSALESAINTHGSTLATLIAGIAVGSEDLYRITDLAAAAGNTDPGAEPSTLAGYMGEVKSALSSTNNGVAAGAPVTHVDTWTVWVNSSNQAVIDACDFIGMDAYPYYETTHDNSIDNAYNLFYNAYDWTAGNTSKTVWVTETGWPVSGPQSNLAYADVADAQTYWDSVGCSLFGNINTYWFILRDAYPTTPSISFGILDGNLDPTPLYDLSC